MGLQLTIDLLKTLSMILYNAIMPASEKSAKTIICIALSGSMTFTFHCPDSNYE